MLVKDLPEYRVWAGMKSRCSNQNDDNYPNYGGRGVTVCERWVQSFEDFLADMGPRPSMDHSLDRYPDNNGNYEPGNCRWATSKEQSNNRRSSRFIVVKGETMTVAEAAEKAGINYLTFIDRVNRGLTDDELLKSPTEPEQITHDGLTLTVIGWARRLGFHVSSIRKWLRSGLTIAEIIGKQKRSSLRTIRGETKTLTEWSRVYNIDEKVVRWRVKHGWELEAALNTPVRPFTYSTKKL